MRWLRPRRGGKESSHVNGSDTATPHATSPAVSSTAEHELKVRKAEALRRHLMRQAMSTKYQQREAVRMFRSKDWDEA